MRRLVGAALVFSAVAVVNAAPRAFAADLPVKAPYVAAPVAFSWTGFYVGANVGVASGNYKLSAVQGLPVPPFFAIDNAAQSAAGSPSIRQAGVIGGVQAGYNWQVGNWVWGFEADFDGQGIRGGKTTVTQFPSTLPGGGGGAPAFFSTSTTVSSDWLFTARPRVGLAMDRWMLYATGGLAVGNEKYTQVVALAAPFVATNTASATRAGWTVGGGFEYAFLQNWSFKAEYLHVDLGSIAATGILTPAFAGYTNTASMRFTEEIGRIGINYRFQPGPVVARY